MGAPGKREGSRQERGLGHRARNLLLLDPSYLLSRGGEVLSACPSYPLPLQEGPRTAPRDNADSTPTVQSYIYSTLWRLLCVPQMIAHLWERGKQRVTHFSKNSILNHLSSPSSARPMLGSEDSEKSLLNPCP